LACLSLENLLLIVQLLLAAKLIKIVEVNWKKPGTMPGFYVL